MTLVMAAKCLKAEQVKWEDSVGSGGGEGNPAGAASLYKRVKTVDTHSILAPKGFHDAPHP